MGLCYANPPFSQLAKVLTKIALKEREWYCVPQFATFLSWGSLGHLILRGFPRGKSGAEVGIVNRKVARRANIPPRAAAWTVAHPPKMNLFPLHIQIDLYWICTNCAGTVFGPLGRGGV